MHKTGVKPEDIKIDPEFRDLLCPLSEYEEKALEGSLLADGCLCPLIIEEKLGVLIDGHNRLRICKEHDIPFEVKTLMLGGREPAEKWIISKQLGRRNLTPERLKIYIAQLYRNAKKKAEFSEGHDFKGNQHTNKANVVRGQNDRATKKSETAKKIAEQVNRSEKTVRRYDKEVEAVEKAGKLKEYESGKLPKAEVKKIVEKSKPVRKQTKAEAQEEAEVIAENQHLFKENKQPKIESPDKIKPIINMVKASNLTKEEIKSLIEFLKLL